VLLLLNKDQECNNPLAQGWAINFARGPLWEGRV